MLNPFPEILAFSLLGPFVLRLVAGIIFIDLGLLKLKTEKIRWTKSFEALGIRPADLFVAVYGVLQVGAGLMLLLGFFTQGAALFFTIFTGIELAIEWKAREVLKRDLVFYILLFTISISLLFTGAGAFAFDLPL